MPPTAGFRHADLLTDDGSPLLTLVADDGMLRGTVGSTIRPLDDERDARTATLGDLLYREKTSPPIREDDWVRLLSAIAAGDQRALHELYERTHLIVFTLVVRLVNDRTTAEQLTVDVFHDVWRHASTYDAARGSVVGWILNLARSRAIEGPRPAPRKAAEAPTGTDGDARTES